LEPLLSIFHLRRQIPVVIAIPLLILFLFGGMGAGYLLLTETPGVPQDPDFVHPQPPVLPAGSFSPFPLEPGTNFPLFEAEGWLNDSPPLPNSHGQNLLVVDIWAGWCPACRETAPGLVKAHERFKDRVVFVSLTNLPRPKVELFAEQFAIPWPCGYGATHESLARYGAYSTDRLSPTYNPGYEVSPTLFIVSAEGRILWNDGQARPRHLKTSGVLMRDFNAALEKLLVDEKIPG
jgi:thiol-disulfide isomerase/thioredoxin